MAAMDAVGEETDMEARMKNPALIIDAMAPFQPLWGAVMKAVPATLLHLVHLRTSQINGCSVCVDNAARAARKEGEREERLIAVGAWRHAPYFNEGERAALALAEAMTRMADRSDPVPDALWQEAQRHFDERALAGLVMAIGIVNVWNRINVTTAQVGGEWKA